MKISKVKVVGENNLVPVSITSEDKPQIPEEIAKKWQDLVNLMAKIIDVPAGLIMKLEESFIEVFIRSNQEENPYHENEKAELQMGLYCETVVGKRALLLVPDAREDTEWKNNPDVELDMISYLGLPIVWPDGEVFGTICVLDNKENKYSDFYIDLLSHFKEVIEQDLKIILERDYLKKQNLHKELILREIHHRIKNNFNILISILRLKSQQQDNTDEVLKDLEFKIKAFSMVHEKIFKGENLLQLKLNDYVSELVHYIIAGFKPLYVKLDIQVDDFLININQIIPLGMLINELLVNSMKHAFRDQPNPSISLEIKVKEKDILMMKYRDNGVGFPEGFNIKETESLGFQLIKSLTKEMNGDLSVRSENGVEIEFSFKLPASLN